MVRNCKFCDKEFKRHAGKIAQEFCSKSCLAQFQTIDWRGKERKCMGCNDAFMPTDREHRYCTKGCVSKSNAIHKFANGISVHRKTAKSYLNKTHCERCGWSQEPGILELHHRDRNGRNNDIKNLEVLCPNCHSLEHFEANDGQFKNNRGFLRNIQNGGLLVEMNLE
jgi:hypothetical protein